MKTKFLPILAIVLAVGGAFAFNKAPEKSALVDINGVLPGSCEEVSVICTTIPNPNFCSSGSNWLYKMNAAGTDCPDHLYRKQ